MDSYQKHYRAPELFGDFWFNGEPVSMRDSRGSAVLVDFWDSTSAHCIRALPYVKAWDEKYRSFGLLTVGVHTPEFKFGQDPENVSRALKELGVTYPVVSDNEARIWTSFGSRTWPTKYLVDKDGFIRFAHQGEGSYEQFERSIQFLLSEAGMRGELPDLMDSLRETDVPGAICYRTTAEVRTGYLRGAIGSIEGFGPESTLYYEDQGIYLAGRFYLHGAWANEKECVRLDGPGKEKGSISLRYEAAEVCALLSSDAASKSKVFVQQDGHWLTQDERGSDIVVGSDGSTSLIVDRPRLFNLVKNRRFGEHVIRLSSSGKGLRAYTFSFITSVISDVVNANPEGIGMN